MRDALLEEATTTPVQPNTPDQASTKKMTGVEKAAVLFANLGKDEIDAICRHLDRSEVEKIAAYLKKFDAIDQQAVLTSIQDFQSESTGDYVPQTPVEKAKYFIKEFEQIQIESTPEGKIRSQFTHIFGLEKLPPADVVALFASDHSQVFAVVLSQLSPDYTKEVLSVVDVQKRADLLKRISTLKIVDANFLKNIDDFLKTKLADSHSKSSAYNGPLIAANILTLFPEEESKQFMDELEKDFKPVLDSIKKYYITFSDIIALENDTLQKILATVDPSVLSQALCKSSKEVIDKCFAVITKRAVTLIEEELKTLQNVMPVVVQDAQKLIIKNARQLESERKIDLGLNKK